MLRLVLDGHLTTIGDDNVNNGLVLGALLHVLDLANNVHSLHDVPKNHMLVVKMGCILRSNELHTGPSKKKKMKKKKNEGGVSTRLTLRVART
jgi:hypothetical protein